MGVPLKRYFLSGLVLLISAGCQPSPDTIQAVADGYIDAWASFYPSHALSAGQADAAFRFEDFSQRRIDEWLDFNRQALERLQNLGIAESLDDRIDTRLLEQQIRREEFKWGEVQIHRTDPLLYSNLINHSLTPVLVRQNLSDQQKIDAVIQRMQGLQRLCDTARGNLVDGRPASTEAAAHHIRSTAAFLEQSLASALGCSPENPHHEILVESCIQTANSLNDLAQWLENELSISSNDAYGEQRYARELALAYGADMRPEMLEQLALTEIQTVRGLMEQLARSYWEGARTEPVPADFEQLMLPVLAEMELNRAQDQEEFLQVFLDLIDRSEQFLREKDLVDLPEHRTLFTDLSPAHFAGAAVGGVYSAGPFDPEAETLFYLPTVPDSAPEEARDNFYRSFNNHFNSTIITHEIYPGHYLQLKYAAYQKRRVRALFAGDDFAEGWASFCEQMTLDEGWDDDQALTRLAHLRKRLENAVRAFVSVQVHCRGWGRDELQEFAVETGLLPPQFAENLWHRALYTPIQLPSYFIGFRQFNDVYDGERARLDERFSLKELNNRVVQSGGIPLDMLEEYLGNSAG